MFVRKLIITTIVLGIMLPVFFVNAGTILSSYKYAWSNNSGYINFENVVVDKDILSGYAWSANHGWIKFNPTQGGVFNDGEGNLSGFAWGEQLGWIDFNGVKINTNGKFTGNATGTLAGIVNFDCPNYCDVRTDWAQATTTPIVTPVTPDTQSNNRSSSSGSRLNLPQSIPLIVESKKCQKMPVKKQREKN